MNAETAKKLREPFPGSAVGKLPRITCKACSQSQDKVCASHSKARCSGCGNYITEKHIHIDYVGHAAVTDRLLSADPGWTYRLLAVNQDGSPVVFREGLSDPVAKCGIWIELTIGDTATPGFGEGKNFKEAIGDAIRNAAMRRGVALDLWTKEDLRSDEPLSEAATGPSDPGSSEADASSAPVAAASENGSPADITKLQQIIETLGPVPLPAGVWGWDWLAKKYAKDQGWAASDATDMSQEQVDDLVAYLETYAVPV